MVIDGHTAVILHLANPAAHLQTPQRLNRAALSGGINAVLVPWQVQPEDLAQMMGGHAPRRKLARRDRNNPT